MTSYNIPIVESAIFIPEKLINVAVVVLCSSPVSLNPAQPMSPFFESSLCRSYNQCSEKWQVANNKSEVPEMVKKQPKKGKEGQ